MDESELPWKFKASIYLHGILSPLLWPLLDYDVFLTIVKSFDRKISHLLCRWLILHCSLSSSVTLYKSKNKLQLHSAPCRKNLCSPGQEKCSCTEALVTPKSTRPAYRWGWGGSEGVQETVDWAEVWLRYSVLVGAVASWWAGHGSIPRLQYNNPLGKHGKDASWSKVRVRFMCRDGGNSHQQDGWDATARSLGSLGAGYGTKDFMVRIADSRASLDQIYDSISLLWFPSLTKLFS